MTSFVNVCDVKSAEKGYACLKIVNDRTKINMTCVSSHRCGQEKGVPAKGIYFPRQNYRFYLFDKSWYFPAKHVI